MNSGVVGDFLLWFVVEIVEVATQTCQGHHCGTTAASDYNPS